MGLLEVFDRIALIHIPPEVFDRVADIEVHMSGDFDALDAGWVLSIVAGVDCVFFKRLLIVVCSRCSACEIA